MSRSPPLVSIIIPSWNDEETVRICLESCLKQTYENIEIIVVDSFSEDSTPEICKEFPITLIQEESGMAEARNIGYEYAEGEYVYHVDADMELTPKVVETCVDYCEGQGFDALLIPEENVGGGYWSNCLKFGKRINRREERGNLRFLTSNLYARVDGHDPERLSGEDWDLHQRVQQQPGVEIGQIDEVVVHHVEMMSLREILSKKRKYAASQGDIPDDERRSLEPYDHLKRYLRNIDVFITDPIHAFGYLFIMVSNAGLVRYYRVCKSGGYESNE